MKEKDFAQDVLNEGVCVVRKIYSSSDIDLLNNETCKIRKIVMEKIRDMQRPLKNYSDIAERELGRLDYRCGFTGDVFDALADPVVRIVNATSPTVDFRYYWGVITSLPGAGPTNMHRDVYSIVNTTKNMNMDALDLGLPPYYFTVLIPLVEITNENGPTQFIKRSHRKPVVNDEGEKFTPLLSPGDMTIFDGRTMHRGLPNASQAERLVAYITFVAKWYHDQTFTINDYLLPELAAKGRY